MKLEQALKSTNLEKLPEFLDHLNANPIGKLGGRKFYDANYEGTVSLNNIIKVICNKGLNTQLDKKQKRVLRKCIDKIFYLDLKGNEELSKKNLPIRLLTSLRQLVGKIFFNRAKALKTLEKLATPTNKVGFAKEGKVKLPINLNDKSESHKTAETPARGKVTIELWKANDKTSIPAEKGTKEKEAGSRDNEIIDQSTQKAKKSSPQKEIKNAKPRSTKLEAGQKEASKSEDVKKDVSSKNELRAKKLLEIYRGKALRKFVAFIQIKIEIEMEAKAKNALVINGLPPSFPVVLSIFPAALNSTLDHIDRRKSKKSLTTNEFNHLLEEKFKTFLSQVSSYTTSEKEIPITPQQKSRFELLIQEFTARHEWTSWLDKTHFWKKEDQIRIKHPKTDQEEITQNLSNDTASIEEPESR